MKYDLFCAARKILWIVLGALLGIEGTLYGANGTLIEVIDPSLGTQFAQPINLAVTANNTFFITNIQPIGASGTGSIVGWAYNLTTATLVEVQDPSLGTQTAHSSNIAVTGNNIFFISNGGNIGTGGTGSIVGWAYDPSTSSLVEVQDPSLGTQLATPANVVAAANNTFFITNSGNIGTGGTGSIVGWAYDPGTAILVEVQDPSLGTQLATPANVVAAANNTFFIANSGNIGTGGTGSIVGWSYDPSTATLVEVQDPSLGGQSAFPHNIAAAGNSTFFIANDDSINAGGPSTIVGWTYDPSTVTLVEVQDPSLGTQTASPFNVAAAANNTFFISNQDTIGTGGTGSIVGWAYDPATTTLVEVQDPSLGTQTATPLNIAAAGNNTFFISNNGSIGTGGTGSIVGWSYDPTTATLLELQDPSLGTQLATPAHAIAAGNNTFFITNEGIIGATGTGSIVGWYFGTISSTPPSFVQGFSKRDISLNQIDYYNLIQWSSPSQGSPVGYRIFRDAALTDLIAALPVYTLHYRDHNRKIGKTYSYFVVAVESDGTLSSPVEVQVFVKKK